MAALPEGEIAVGTMRKESLVTVFDQNGRLVREFGEPETISERKDLNRFLNLGEMASDASGAFVLWLQIFPGADGKAIRPVWLCGRRFTYTAIGRHAGSSGVRREIEKQEKRGGTPQFKQVMTAMGVDQQTGEVWIAMGNILLHFDKEGNRRATFRLYTPRSAAGSRSDRGGERPIDHRRRPKRNLRIRAAGYKISSFANKSRCGCEVKSEKGKKPRTKNIFHFCLFFHRAKVEFAAEVKANSERRAYT